MGEWSNFFKRIGEIVNEVSRTREQYLQAQNQRNVNIRPTATIEEIDTQPGNSLYPDLRNISNDVRTTPAEEINVSQVVTPDQAARNRRRRNQQRADDEEEWEVLGDRNRNRNPPRGGGNSGNGNMGAFAALGIAGVALGAYAAYKAYCSPDEADSPMVTSQSECVNRLKKLKEDIDEFPVVGLDCQWLINTSPYEPRHPIALLQLATHKGHIMLVPMKKFTIPDALRSILNDSQIIKTGIEVIKDARYLREDYGINIHSTFDLRFLAEDTAHRPEGLEKLSKSVLNLDIGRDWEITKSDWEKWPLEPTQVSYAETAVKASIDIFKTLYPFTGNGPNRRDVLNYCNLNMDRPFV